MLSEEQIPFYLAAVLRRNAEQQEFFHSFPPPIWLLIAELVLSYPVARLYRFVIGTLMTLGTITGGVAVGVTLVSYLNGQPMDVFGLACVGMTMAYAPVYAGFALWRLHRDR
jgi:hypothetical protein